MELYFNFQRRKNNYLKDLSTWGSNLNMVRLPFLSSDFPPSLFFLLCTSIPLFVFKHLYLPFVRRHVIKFWLGQALSPEVKFSKEISECCFAVTNDIFAYVPSLSLFCVVPRPTTQPWWPVLAESSLSVWAKY